MSVQQLTIRGVEQDLHHKLKTSAQQEGISVNKYVLKLLKDAMGLTKPDGDKRIGNQLDWFIGTWTDEEAEEFDRIIRENDQIDWEMWE